MANVEIGGIAKQLLREFWLSGVLALCWSGYGIWRGDVTGAYGFIKTFGPAFFLASWGAAQYFRVTKQARVESDLSRLQNQTKDLLQALDGAAKRLSELATGGKSFCFLTFRNVSGATHRALMHIKVIGETPMYDVRIRVTNIEMLNEFVEANDDQGIIYKSSIERNLGNLSSEYFDLRDWPSLGSYPVHTFNIEWAARNGNYSQHYRMRLVGDRWSHRTMIRDALGIKFEQCDNDYPVELDTDFFPDSCEPHFDASVLA